MLNPCTASFQALSVNACFGYVSETCGQSGMVIKFDNHVTSQHGGHFGNRRFSYAVRVFHFLFGIARLMYP